MNTRAVEARTRRDAEKAQAAEQAQRALEDAYWQDDDKHAAARSDRRAERQQRGEAQTNKKAELKRIAEEEESALVSHKQKKAPPPKITRAQLVQMALAAAKEKATAAHEEEPQVTVLEPRNRPLAPPSKGGHPEDIEATGINDALAAFQALEPTEIDAHPERRVKAAYKAYEERNLPLLKQEYPGLKLSQLKERLGLMWKKSPENPLVKAKLDRRA